MSKTAFQIHVELKGSSVHIARETVENVESAGWKINTVKNLTKGGIFKRIEATKSA